VREVKWESKVEEELEREKEEREELEWAWEVNRVRMREAEERDARWTIWKKRKEKDKADKFGGAEVEPWEELAEEPFDDEKLLALERLRKALFVTYPQAELEGHPHFLRTEHELLSKLLSREIDIPGGKARRRRRRRTQQIEEEGFLDLDLTKPTPVDEPILLVAGGQPGLGNPSFLTHEDRSPKYATRGGDGEMMRLELEVKSTGEVGLVGLPNAGKRCAFSFFFSSCANPLSLQHPPPRSHLLHSSSRLLCLHHPKPPPRHLHPLVRRYLLRSSPLHKPFRKRRDFRHARCSLLLHRFLPSPFSRRASPPSLLVPLCSC
jgi:hypothetical protein